MLTSPNLSLDYIDVNAAQREVVHNAALRSLDALVQLAVLDRDLATPPGAPSDGQRWIVAASPTGAWSGHTGHVAAWQDGAWHFYVPRVGWYAYLIDDGNLIAWNGSAWVSALAMLATLQNLALLGVGTTADATNPFSAKLNNTLWVAKTVAEGGDGNLRYKLSKESAAKTLSLLLQDNFSGRAEIGLTGDDDLHLKVSSDGSTWTDAVKVAGASGAVAITASNALALPVGRQGATNPALQVDASAASCVTGLKFAAAAAGSRLALAVNSSGTDEGLSIDGKGAGTIRLGATSTGAIEFGRNAVPTSNDGAALGTMSLMWSDLFLASGAVINFNNGNATLTHSSGLLTLAGGRLALSDTTASTSSTTGSLTTAGGFAAAGAVYCGAGVHALNTAGFYFGANQILYTLDAGSGQLYTGISDPDGTNGIYFGNVAAGKAMILSNDTYNIRNRNASTIYMQIGPGIAVGSPSGGDKGAGTINVAGDIYKNNTAYTNPDFVFEHFYRGGIDKFAQSAGAADYAGLMPLADLRTYTQSNLRLPGMTDEPCGMFERGDQVLRYLEEHTLYLFDHEDRIEQLTRDNTALRGRIEALESRLQ